MDYLDWLNFVNFVYGRLVAIPINDYLFTTQITFSMKTTMKNQVISRKNIAIETKKDLSQRVTTLWDRSQ